MIPNDKFSGCTGTLFNALPPGEERDELLGLVRLGIPFAKEHKGKRPEFLRRYVTGVVLNMPDPVRFNDLLTELALLAARRELYGEGASPVEKIDKTNELITFHDTRKGRLQRTFGRLRNILTDAKKEKFPCTANP